MALSMTPLFHESREPMLNAPVGQCSSSRRSSIGDIRQLGSAISVRLVQAIGLGLLWLGLGSAASPPRSHVSFKAVQLDPSDPTHIRVGGLHYLGGWQIDSRQPGFGGYSALATHDGNFIALADTGNYMLFRLSHKGRFDNVGFGNLPDYPGRNGNKGDMDSESMTIAPDGRIWIGFEIFNAIYRYAPGLTAVTGRSLPPAMKDWPGNRGPESLVRMTDGRFLVLCEDQSRADGTSDALIFPGDPTESDAEPVHFLYKPPEDYVAVDAQQLPDGRIVVLNRHFRLADGLWAAVTIFDPRTIRPGELVQSEPVAEIRPPLTIDNMEGLAVSVEAGETILWMISDDNQLPVQRTLLLKFALKP